jgi:hypothetical protein
MIKIIISHDVDHLYARDHWFRDLVYPKLWIRSTLKVLSKEITLKECWLRCVSCLKKERNCISELMKFDKKYGVPSTYFFGVRKGLGMSYFPDEARKIVDVVSKNGFQIGIHGICFDSDIGIQEEYQTFEEKYGFKPCGIRMHYVRYDDTTFVKEAKVGYIFDTTEFEKDKKGTQKMPYKIGDMWEFPLTIMDGYLPQKLELAKQETLRKLQECKNKNLEYVSILFHDYQFCSAYQDMQGWYRWLISYIKESPEYCFISYQDAIKELENQNG